jgi:hypothetical protein
MEGVMDTLLPILALAAAVTAIVLSRRYLAKARKALAEAKAINQGTRVVRDEAKACEARVANAVEINRQTYVRLRSFTDRMLATDMTPAMRATAKRVFNEGMDELRRLPEVAAGRLSPPVPDSVSVTAPPDGALDS